MASTSQRDSLTENVTTSVKNDYSTVAPKTTISQLAQTTTGKRFKKIFPKNGDSDGTLGYKIDGERIKPGNWCSNCQNGGTIFLCIVCGTNSICAYCIELDDSADLNHINLECPSCFLKKDKNGQYPFSFRQTISTRQHWPKVITSPLAVISIHLVGMKDTPGLITFYHLQPWLQGNVVHIELGFSFEKGIDIFNARLDSMLDRFENGDLKDWARFFVCITTHSEPTSGFLHIAPKNGGAISVKELFDTIFSTRFRTLLKKNGSNILSLLSCGYTSTHEDSRSELKNFADKGIFSKIICFDQPMFQPSLVHAFFMDIGLKNFIYDRMKLDSILRDHQALGAHTNVIEFQEGKTSTFIWTHPGMRPMGQHTANQCRNCKRLKTRRPTVSSKTIITKCMVCSTTDTYNVPSDCAWVFGPPVKGDERGAWLVRVDGVKDADSMDTT